MFYFITLLSMAKPNFVRIKRHNVPKNLHHFSFAHHLVKMTWILFFMHVAGILGLPVLLKYQRLNVSTASMLYKIVYSNSQAMITKHVSSIIHIPQIGSVFSTFGEFYQN